MARKPRLEFEGAMHHILKRENYQADVFGRPGAAEAVEKAPVLVKLIECVETVGDLAHRTREVEHGVHGRMRRWLVRRK
jgi:hypothetical protein